VPIDVGETLLIAAKVLLKAMRLFEAVVSKLVPVMVTAVPAAPIVGVKLVMVGAADATTVNEALLVAKPVGVLTVIGPVVAPAGTLVTIWVGVDDVTVAVVPLNLIVFWAGVELKFVP
jgi:hypothetical protein